MTPSALCPVRVCTAQPPAPALLSVSPQLSSPGLPALPLLTADIPGSGAPGNIPWFAADCPAPQSLRCGQSGRRPGGRGPGAGETACPPNPTPAPGTRRGRQRAVLADWQRDLLGRWGGPPLLTALPGLASAPCIKPQVLPTSPQGPARPAPSPAPSPPCSLCSSQRGLLAVPPTHQAQSCPRAFACIVLTTSRSLVPEITQVATQRDLPCAPGFLVRSYALFAYVFTASLSI